MKRHKRLFRRLLAGAAALALAVPASAVGFAAPAGQAQETLTWDLEAIAADDGLSTPFRPGDGYVSKQNPPDFSWIMMAKATSYDLVVATDPALENVAFHKEGIPYNFYNFDVTFETGVSYYWAVRYNVGEKPSPWSSVRRFRIRPDAYTFTLPDTDTLLARVPESHPRIFTTQENLETFRAIKDTSPTAQEAYQYIMDQANKYYDAGVIPGEPKVTWSSADSEADRAAKMQTMNADAGACYGIAFYCGYAYLLTGDEELGKFGVKALLEMSGWDINGATSYANQDQTFRSIAYQSAIAYDWLYPLMTQSERDRVLAMIQARGKVLEYLLTGIQKTPFNSHGWTALGYMGIISIATYGEIPEAADWLRVILPTYASNLPPWSNEDGGWSQGTDYWRYSTNSNKEFIDILALAGVADFNAKAWCQEEYNWSMYAYPYGSWGSFGDQSNLVKNTSDSGQSLYKQALFIKNPVTAWLAEQQPWTITGQESYVDAQMKTLPVTPPYNYPLAHEFSDIGWVVMTNDVIDPNRIQMTFKSSPYGSYNHSHADQNSFIIQAFGENLAAKSGYYDAYHSVHDSGFTRTTAAHNSVTVYPSLGQKDDDIMAKGQLTGFLNQVDFDLAMGDASQAYNGRLSGFDRCIIYIRPDVFLVVDDLVAAPGEKSKFEWWLNAIEDISLYEEGNGAKIVKGAAELDAVVQYPQKVNSYYENRFMTSNGKEFAPSGSFASRPVHKRVWFETEETERTKMIVTMDVHRSVKEAKYTNTEYFDNYVKLTFEDGTVALVNLGDKSETVETEDGFAFAGRALVYNDQSLMLADGDFVQWGETELIRAEKPMSLVVGQNELGISTYEDNRISLHTGNDYLDKVEKITDYEGHEMSQAWGVACTKERLTASAPDAEGNVRYTTQPDENYITLQTEADNYSLMLNGKMVDCQEIEASVKVTIDGQESDTPIQGYQRRDGSVNCASGLTVPSGKYRVVDKNSGLELGWEIGEVGNMGTLNVSTDSTENYLVLESVPVNPAEVTVEEDYDAVKDRTAVCKEAEDFQRLGSGNIYTTRNFLSGGAGVTEFNDPTTSAEYTIEVAEAGDYDFVVKYVGDWDDTGLTRMVAIGDHFYSMVLPRTESWGSEPGQWRTATANTGIHLEPGTYTVTLEPVSGSWNFDWFGLIKK